MVLGEDLSQEDYDKFTNRSGDLFMVKAFKEGIETSYFVTKEVWDNIKAQIDAIRG